MFNLFRRKILAAPKRKQNNSSDTFAVEGKKTVEVPECIIEESLATENEVFSDNICRYIGSTVTIFLRAGGICGSGITGVLISSNSTYISLLTHIGPPPACPLFNSCSFKFRTFPLPMPNYSCLSVKYGKPIFQTGSITNIPVNKIAAFVHNAI
jgi:hypothetical protein